MQGVDTTCKVTEFKHAVKWTYRNKLEMWANAQCNGCLVEYRWCLLINAAKFD